MFVFLVVFVTSETNQDSLIVVDEAHEDSHCVALLIVNEVDPEQAETPVVHSCFAL